jgi:hypothetical protein
MNTRLACIQLLGESRDAEVREQLCRLADTGGVPARVRSSILETVERVAQPVAAEPVAVAFD